MAATRRPEPHSEALSAAVDEGVPTSVDAGHLQNHLQTTPLGVIHPTATRDFCGVGGASPTLNPRYRGGWVALAAA